MVLGSQHVGDSTHPNTAQMSLLGPKRVLQAGMKRHVSERMSRDARHYPWRPGKDADRRPGEIPGSIQGNTVLLVCVNVCVVGETRRACG